MSDKRGLDDLWEEAFSNPNHPVDLGRKVFCDLCGEDWTDSAVSGGFIFGSKGVCPTCAPRFMQGVRSCGEEHYVRGTCAPEQSFADFVREYRGDNNTIRVIKPGRL